MKAYWLLALIWSAWCFFHSFFISRSVDRFLRKRLGDGYRYVRVGYNLLALASLVPVLVFSESLRAAPVFSWAGPLRIGQGLMLLGAFLLFAAGARRYDFLQFAGLRQIRSVNDCSAITEDCSIDTTGVLGVVRHPWYSGGILLIWARNLDPAALVTNTVLTVYFIVGAFLEERKLLDEYGASYRAYQRRVSMLVPVKWLLGRWRSNVP